MRGMQEIRVVAVVTAACLALLPGAAGGEIQVADCERGPITAGSGPPGWRDKSVAAGPLGVFRNPLRQMSETESGQLIAKMPVVVESGPPVTLSVPPRLRHRVWLYYGRLLDRSGQPTTQIGRSRGFSEVIFEPCQDRRRTVWPGGIRIKGRAAVRLRAQVEGGTEQIPLPLGRPKPYRGQGGR